MVKYHIFTFFLGPFPNLISGQTLMTASFMDMTDIIKTVGAYNHLVPAHTKGLNVGPLGTLLRYLFTFCESVF